MYIRQTYLDKIAPFIRKPVVKVITGMRRVGKSYFIRQIMDRLRQSGVPEANIVYINKEQYEFDAIQTYHDLHQYIDQYFAGISGRCYVFVDEIQEIAGWEKSINSLLATGNHDIYITGSNAHLLSSELATLISGRYIEFPVYSLGFDEFLTFRGDEKDTTDHEFLKYLRYGGLPAIHHFGLDDEIVYQYINSLYDTILLKDVIKKNHIRNVQLLEDVTHFVFDNIGNIFSARKISDYLKSQRLKVGVETVQNYLAYLASTYIVYKVPRYDIRGKRLLEISEKYYVGDIGIRHALRGFREADISGLLENIVFLELKRRGYQVFVGKQDNREVDFIAEKEGTRHYFQISYLLANDAIIEREFSPLIQIRDNYPKYVLSMDTAFGEDVEGIQRRYLPQFLLDSSI